MLLALFIMAFRWNVKDIMNYIIIRMFYNLGIHQFPPVYKILENIFLTKRWNIRIIKANFKVGQRRWKWSMNRLISCWPMCVENTWHTGELGNVSLLFSCFGRTIVGSENWDFLYFGGRIAATICRLG